ncbi:MAG: amidohydrolase family protein [Desulfohalobiaceae bacterium]|nr:amidohydrolase family protein [Desulfohalobiaceae bacterium]
MDRKLIKGGNLYAGQRYLSDQPAAVFVVDERIEALGQEALNAAESDDVQVFDCPDQTLMPGLIDCHTHLSLDPDLPDYLLRMQDPIPELTLRAVQTMKRDLLSGVTTARCLGDKDFLDIHCKKAQAEGLLPGPGLLVAGRGIRAPHGHGFVGSAFSGPENVRQAVRENISAGADLIKVYLTGTVRGPRGMPCTFSEDEVRVLVDEAHRAGLPVATHCIGGPGFDLALECGIDVIEHGYFLSQSQIEALDASSTWLVLTPSIFFSDQRLETLHGNLKQIHLQQREQVARVMQQVVKSSVRWVVGTDGMHAGLAAEIEHLVGFGAEADRAIAGITTKAADLMALSTEIGSLAKGKRADLIGVQGDPIQDVSALARVRTVIQGGKVIRRTESDKGALADSGNS